jgi:threonine dehydratase
MASHPNLITLPDIWQAKKQIRPYVRQTPLQACPGLGEKVYLKLENLHEIGSFKIRGAANKLLLLSEDEKARGVTTFSTGNHGLAVASMAKELGVRAVICISNRVPAAKVDRLRHLGAEVKKVGNTQDDAEAYAFSLQENAGFTVVPPFDDHAIIAGQGTIGMELIEQLPSLDMAIIPVSGGGLFSGISIVLKKYNPSIRIIGVSMEKSPVMFESIRAGKPVIVQEEDTLADSLLGGIGANNRYTFHMVQDHIDDFVLLTEDEIASGMAFMLDQHQFAVEGAAATGIAAILSGKVDVKGKTVATMITGKNVDMSTILRVCQNAVRKK